jgi:hypothetical protein
MKTMAPVLLSIGGAIIAITTAIAGARGAFRGVVPLTPYLIAYGVAVLAFIIAAFLYYAQDERPNVAPVRYDNAPTGTARSLLGNEGLVVTNDGDPAYEVHLVSGNVGDSTPTYQNRIQRLTKNEAEGFFPINMQRRDGGGLLGGLFEEMRQNKVEALPVTIRYKNGKGHRYRTTFKIIRDVTAAHGLSIKDVHHGRDWFGLLRSRLGRK